MPGHEVFPTPAGYFRLPLDHVDTTLHDVKFYPYATTADDQICALVGGDTAIILRPKLNSEPPFEILRWFRDEQVPRADYNSLCWTKDPVTKKPLLCIAGAEPKHIKILDVESARPVRTLAGHGKDVLDLAVSPLSTNLIASSSYDNTIRLWNLEEKYSEQPCVALFAGEGHKSHVLAISFHPNGRWLLSGGDDTAVCLWAVPSMSELDDVEIDDTGYREPKIIFYPHFFSKEVHPNYVDCLSFYGDLVISKSARGPEVIPNEILIWKIEGFDPDADPPAEPPVPTAGERTRSSFTHDRQGRGFQRLLTLDNPHSNRFYHRFGLLSTPGMRPILAYGNEQSVYNFWDLARLDEGTNPRKQKKRAQSLSKTIQGLDKRALPGEGNSETASRTSTPDPQANQEREYTLSDPFTPLAPHLKKTIDTRLPRLGNQMVHFATSQIAFSPDGTWMVGCGDHGIVCLFHRDQSVVKDREAEAK